MNSYYVLCTYWRLEIGDWRFDVLFNELGVNMSRNIRIDIGLKRRLGSFHYRFKEGVVVLWKNQRKGHLETRDTNIVLQHSALYQILARSRVSHMPQGIYYLLWIHKKMYDLNIYDVRFI